MPRDVTQPLANALPDFATTRRAEAKAGHGKPSFSADGAEAANPRFDRMVSSEAQQARVAEQARKRQRDGRALADAPPRNAPKRPEPNRTERDGELARHKDERAATADPADVKPDERPARRTEGGKPVETGDTGTGAEASDERSVCIGPAEEIPEETVVVSEAGEEDASDAVLLAEAMLAAQSDADPAAAVGGSATDLAAVAAGSGVAGSVTPGVPGAAAAAQASAGTPAIGAVADGATDTPGNVDGIAAPVVQAQNNPKAQSNAKGGVATDPSGIKSGSGETADAALMAASKAPGQGAKTAPGAEGAAGAGEAPAHAETGKGGKAETVVDKSTVPNLHPTRAAHFADFLDAFGGSSAIHRPADILAGLDRSPAASALNRGAEVLRPTPLQMLPIEIGMQAVRGVTNFQIRLDPAELGRIDVKLQIRDNGEVNASLVVDRVETLQMLKRDASSLEFAFEQAGLKQSPDGLTFSLRGEGQNSHKSDQRQPGGPNEMIDDALAAQIGEAAMRRVLIPNSSIDRMV